MATIIIFIVILGVLVFVHELGHFLTAVKLGVKVDEFGIGFPPRAVGLYKDENGKWKFAGPKKKKAASTVYSLNWIPLGGFVKIKGEQGEHADESDSFGHKSIGARIFIISAGVLMNVLLAFVLLSVGYKVGLPEIIEESTQANAVVRDEKIQIIDVVEDLPAQKEGLQLGDTLVSVDGIIFDDVGEVSAYISQRAGEVLSLEVLRGTETVIKEITPEVREDSDGAVVGVVLVKTGLISYPFFQAIAKGAETTWFLLRQIIIAFYTLFKDLIFGKGVTVDVSGPVGIAILTGQVAQQGFIYILQFTSLLSLNLAIINFLPFPALDGGRVVFLLFEKIRGKAVPASVEAVFHNVGFLLLMVLALLVTLRDVFRLF